MNIAWDPSVSPVNQAAIQAAIDDCTFDFTHLLITWTVQVTANAGHNGRFEALTTITAPGFDVLTQFTPGLFTPGSPYYVSPAFVKECVIHELAHVLTLGMLTVAEQQNFAAMLGFDYATQWDSPGAAWEDLGKEAVAETFKDLFLPAVSRQYLNRTHFHLARWALPYFPGVCCFGLRSIVEAFTPVEIDVGTPAGFTNVSSGFPITARWYECVSGDFYFLNVQAYTAPWDGSPSTSFPTFSVFVLQGISAGGLLARDGGDNYQYQTDLSLVRRDLNHTQYQYQGLLLDPAPGPNDWLVEFVSVNIDTPEFIIRPGDVDWPPPQSQDLIIPNNIVGNVAPGSVYAGAQSFFMFGLLGGGAYPVYFGLGHTSNADFGLVSGDRLRLPLPMTAVEWPYGSEQTSQPMASGHLLAGGAAVGVIR